jgi:phospholipase/carboxylesterase
MSRPQIRKRKIGSLDCLEIEGTPGGPVVIFFHGFGADNSDLASLAQALPVPKGTSWIFPNGHLSVPIGPHMEGRAWFPISVRELEGIHTASGSLEFTREKPPGMKRARELANEMILKLGVPMNRIILGGFSQGAMLATEVAMKSDITPAGLAILSGALIGADDWKLGAEKKPGFSFFQSHGENDPVLSIQGARRLEALLLEAKWSGRLLAFRGGHEIPLEVLSQLGNYLKKSLASLAI